MIQTHTLPSIVIKQICLVLLFLFRSIRPKLIRSIRLRIKSSISCFDREKFIENKWYTNSFVQYFWFPNTHRENISSLKPPFVTYSPFFLKKKEKSVLDKATHEIYQQKNYSFWCIIEQISCKDTLFIGIHVTNKSRATMTNSQNRATHKEGRNSER